MSEFINTLKQKNKAERNKRKYRDEELQRLKSSTAFKARLNDELKKVDLLLDTENIDGVIIEVPDRVYTLFSEAIYSEGLAGYTISQIDNNKNKKLFMIKKHMISFD